MEVDSCVKFNGWLIRWAHHYFLIPYTWDGKKERIEKVQNKKKIVKTVSVWIMIMIVRIGFIVSLLDCWKSIKITELEYFSRIVWAAEFQLAILFDFHIIFNLDGILQTYNALHVYQKAFIHTYGRKDFAETRTLKSKRVTKAILTAFLILIVASPLVYLKSRGAHVLAWILPHSLTRSTSWILIGPLAVANALFHFVSKAAFLIPSLFIVDYTMTIFEFGSELHTRNGKIPWTTPEYRKLSNVIRNHNGLRIWHNQAQDSFFNILYPILMIYSMGIIILLIIGFIKVQFPLVIRLRAFVILVLVLSYMYFCIYIAALGLDKFNSYNKSALNLKTQQTHGKNFKLIVMIRRSLRHLELGVHNFHNIEKHTWVIILMFITSWTVSVLVLIQ